MNGIVSDGAFLSEGGIPTKYTNEVLTTDKDGYDKIVPGLYALGEAAYLCTHGSNRFDANSISSCSAVLLPTIYETR